MGGWAEVAEEEQRHSSETQRLPLDRKEEASEGLASQPVKGRVHKGLETPLLLSGM